MVARRGETLVWSQQVLHSAWHNEDDEPRSGFFASWVADGVSMGGRSPAQIAGQHALWEQLHERMGAIAFNFSPTCIKAQRA